MLAFTLLLVYASTAVTQTYQANQNHCFAAFFLAFILLYLSEDYRSEETQKVKIKLTYFVLGQAIMAVAYAAGVTTAKIQIK